MRCHADDLGLTGPLGDKFEAQNQLPDNTDDRENRYASSTGNEWPEKLPFLVAFGLLYMQDVPCVLRFQSLNT